MDEKGRLPRRFLEHLFRIVQPPLQFGEDDLHLRFQLFGIERAAHHPVRFDLEGGLQLVAGKADVIGGVVVSREGVVATAGELDATVDLPRLHRRCGTEEHVLDDVGDAGDAQPLVPRAHTIEGPDGDDGGGVDFLDEDCEAVREDGLPDLISLRGGGTRRTREEKDESEDEAESLQGGVLAHVPFPKSVLILTANYWSKPAGSR